MDVKPISLTQKAVEEINKIMETKGIPEGYGLRIGVKGGKGCMGMGYMLGFDKAKENDLSYASEGIDIHIEKGQALYLIGLEVDFYEGGDARGFTFTNPNSVPKE